MIKWGELIGRIVLRQDPEVYQLRACVQDQENESEQCQGSKG